MPSTPVSTAMLASSMWQRTCVRILALRPSPAMRSHVEPALRAGDGRGQLQILHAEGIEQFGDLHLLIGGEESVGELLALTQRRLDNGEVVQAHVMRS